MLKFAELARLVDGDGWAVVETRIGRSGVSFSLRQKASTEAAAEAIVERLRAHREPLTEFYAAPYDLKLYQRLNGSGR